MFLNRQKRELAIKIVYYGPGMSGKTTNIEQLYNKIAPDKRSSLTSLKTREDRTLFFDFFSLKMGRIKGFIPKINLYTVPGQVIYESNRRLVLTGADGIVFVADARQSELARNIRSWHDMHKHLLSFIPPLTNIPIVVQFNKQDLPPLTPEPVLKRCLGINSNIPCIKAVAIRCEGVIESFKQILKMVLSRIQV